MFFINMSIHWTALLLFLAISLLGIWVAYSFLNKRGVFFFSVVVAIMMMVLPSVTMFNNNIILDMTSVLMPLVLFSLILCWDKYGKEEAKRLFFLDLVAIGVVVASKFFVCAYMDSALQAQVLLSWNALGSSVCAFAGFALSVFVVNFFVESFPIPREHRYLRRAVLVTIASAISLVFEAFIGKAGVIGIGYMFLIFLIRLVLSAGVAFLVCYLAKFLNRKPKIDASGELTTENVEEGQMEMAQVDENIPEEKVQELKMDEEINYDNVGSFLGEEKEDTDKEDRGLDK